MLTRRRVGLRTTNSVVPELLETAAAKTDASVETVPAIVPISEG